MKKYQTLIISIIICIVGGIIGLLGGRIYHNFKFQELYNNILVEGKNDVLFLGRPTCSFCNLFKPILEKTSKQYHITYQYINTDWLTKKELNKVLDKLNIDQKTFSTPRLIITEGTKIKDHYIGYMDDINLFYYFKNNGLIDSDESFIDPYPNVRRLNSEEYFRIFEEKEDAYIILGRIGDENTEVVLEKANALNNGIQFLNPSVFLTSEDRVAFSEMLTSMKENAMLPLLLEVKDGMVVHVTDRLEPEDIDGIR